MESIPRSQRCLFLGLLLFWSVSHIQVGRAQDDPPAKEETHAEKARKALDTSMVIDFTGNSLQEVLEHLSQKARIHFVLDRNILNGPVDDGMGGAQGGQMNIKSERAGTLRTTLRRFLSPYGLTYVVLEDSVLITTEEMGLFRQMRQRVSIDVKKQPLDTALKSLARRTGLNLVIDPRNAKEAQSQVTLELDDATLETAVKLLAEMGSLKAVRMGNVLFVTSEARAEKIRREEQGNSPLGPEGIRDYFGVVPRMAVPGFAAPAEAPPPMIDPMLDQEDR